MLNMSKKSPLIFLSNSVKHKPILKLLVYNILKTKTYERPYDLQAAVPWEVQKVIFGDLYNQYSTVMLISQVFFNHFYGFCHLK